MTSTEHPRPADTQDVESPLPLAPIRHARERFLAGGPLPDGIPENVVAGWRRARFFGVRRDLAAARDGAAPVSSPLLVAARPVLERLAPALDAEGCALVLADERCRVLWWRGRWSRLTLRHDLSESEVGHNSAAAALRTGRRAEAHGPEHFLDLWQEISAVSVPLRARGSRRPVGTVTVVSGLCAGCGPHPGAALAEAAAAAVEGRLAAGAPPPAEQLLLDAYLRASEDAAPVVAVDGRSRLVSEAAARQLSPEALEALELRAAALLDGGGETASTDGEECAARITPVLDPRSGVIVGVVAVLRQEPSSRASSSSSPSSRRSSKASSPGGSPALPTGSSVPWRHAVGRARELAGTAGPLLLSGERGTGKTALAQALLQESGGPEPLAFDAAQAKRANSPCSARR
ncbi:GAF domain-containing protein [Streptomyces rectiviolaceus]|uniref:GAF domain-containing protein n=2 Tax=Streptomyces rectiviolaceus TaxID=332591 RepID=UPI003632DA3B